MSFILILSFLASSPEVLSIEKIWQTKAHDGQVYKILFSKDGQHIISAGSDKKVKIIDVASGDILSEYAFVTTPYDLALQADGKLLISFKNWKYSSVCSYDSSDSNCKPYLDLRILLDSSIQTGDHEFVESHAIPLSNNTYLTGIGVYSYANPDHYYEGRLDLWNNNIQPTAKNMFSGGMVTNLAISPDKQFIAFSTLYRSSLWEAPYVYRDTEVSKLILTDTTFNEFYILRSDSINGYDTVDSEVFNGIAFSKDSKVITAATDEHNIFIYDIENRQILDSIYSCSCYFDWSIDFVFDGKNVIAGSNDGKVSIWNLEYNVKLDSYTFDGTPAVTSIAASSDKNLYAAGNSDGDIALMFSHYLTGINDENIVTEEQFELINSGNKLYFKINKPFSETKIVIYDILGNPIYNLIMKSSEITEIDISHWATSIYFFEATTDKKVYIEKFIKLD